MQNMQTEQVKFRASYRGEATFLFGFQGQVVFTCNDFSLYVRVRARAYTRLGAYFGLYHIAGASYLKFYCITKMYL